MSSLTAIMVPGFETDVANVKREHALYTANSKGKRKVIEYARKGLLALIRKAWQAWRGLRAGKRGSRAL